MLDRIVRAKREAVERRKAARPLEELLRDLAPSDRSLREGAFPDDGRIFCTSAPDSG